jgi:hypothetical protein
MRDSERALKVISGIVSGLLVISALVFFLIASRKPKVAEAVLEYSAPTGFDPTELAGELDRLRKDQGFLTEVAIRSKFATTSDPDLAEVASKLGGRLSFVANWKKPDVSIRFPHRNATTAIEVANTAAEVAKERLEDQQRKLPTEILAQADAVEDKRKYVLTILHIEAEKGPHSLWADYHVTSTEVKADHERALRKLEGLKAKPVFSIGSIRPAKVISE